MSKDWNVYTVGLEVSGLVCLTSKDLFVYIVE